ncbi:siroheme synthase domain-containing protein [Coccidioides immitis RS]|uniref:precorrin-2 dehydrogenase n=4 Tax=Coccidioides immitis TaxID=5501 RepID=J3KFM7_COCIM|nr:siroheme synthase domain-containing protein [Coccidioides immitis RS]KMP05586.1 uroporphyrin-III C-methyltransferase [Coccidioides immitis RMSCC 2394]KMU77895.1 siroheme synthase [Coccidioides immitis RMSCC 3703]KMU91159.1 siroheme synthase [Coccidioides immitis H538.4]TPX21881.1 Bifunctional dehydrogenase and ferrochelatase [Coccidioides immitis]EAS34443.3 siroheme synthase domain-containing protein [Coccidioides immitis RS]
MPHSFPPIQPGGSLMVAWQVRDKKVLVVGGGEVAAGRILHALNADARVTVVCPSACLNPEVKFRISQNQVTYRDRKFEPVDLEEDVAMVFVAIDDPEASTQIWKLCKERRIPANIADVPSECDFYFGSVHRDGPLQVMVSTNGNGPKLASIVRKEIASALPGNTGAAIQNVGVLRKKLRELAPEAKDGPKRMKWISRICETWSLEELVEMDESDMDSLLAFYAQNTVPTFEQVRLKEEDNIATFDGSMGWSC